MLLENLIPIRSPKRYQDHVLWAWFEIVSPIRDTNSYITLPVIVFSAQYPKRHRKSSRCGPFEHEHPKGYQNLIYTPKRYDEHPSIFIWESAPLRG